ncbi:hypothetical protein C2G38_2207407 [Gigaspora rosea]|uniref:Uncharacterized protein n=1 Tax=Gigaspora rosea TaxID=44941 RepID=A0A397UMF8_9GLOM|nr:hypothetical protein C2G38_2207407 [Gigaspora rosea]
MRVRMSEDESENMNENESESRIKKQFLEKIGLRLSNFDIISKTASDLKVLDDN